MSSPHLHTHYSPHNHRHSLILAPSSLLVPFFSPESKCNYFLPQNPSLDSYFQAVIKPKLPNMAYKASKRSGFYFSPQPPSSLSLSCTPNSKYGPAGLMFRSSNDKLSFFFASQPLHILFLLPGTFFLPFLSAYPSLSG